MINRRQINQLVYERNRRVSITMSAMKAGVSRNTARKYLRQADPSKQEKQAHDWRTRKDPLEAIWSMARGMLERAPELQAKALLEHLSERTAGGNQEKLLRTFQRRVRQWRLEHGREEGGVFLAASAAGSGSGGGLDGHEGSRGEYLRGEARSPHVPCGAAVFELAMGGAEPQRVVALSSFRAQSHHRAAGAGSQGVAHR